MSIWSSWQTVGHDDTFPEDSRGDVRSYASGWSNHYPDPVNGPEKACDLDIASIPFYCVPGHREDDDSDYNAVGPWVRLSVYSWHHDWHSGGKVIEGRQDATVVMDEAAARALRDDLSEWLDRPKAYPRRRPSPHFPAALQETGQ